MVLFKANLCVDVTTVCENEKGETERTSGREWYNVAFCSKEQYLAVEECFGLESIFSSFTEGIKENCVENCEQEGKRVIRAECDYSSSCTELDDGFVDFDKADLDPVELEIVDGVLHIS